MPDALHSYYNLFFNTEDLSQNTAYLPRNTHDYEDCITYKALS